MARRIRKIDASGRTARIIKAVVEEHIETACPVSSGSVAVKPSIGLSPASVRSIMAELERLGYLKRPHASSGCVPTDLSFRAYVDALTGLKEPRQEAKTLINSSFAAPRTKDDLTGGLARALSALTSCAGFMLAHPPRRQTIKHIRITRIDAEKLAVIIMSDDGLLITRLVRAGSAFCGLNMENASNYLDSIAVGLTLPELRGRLIEKMREEKVMYDELLSRALKIAEMAAAGLSQPQPTELCVEGASNVFDQPEFKEDARRMKRIFRAFEEKNLLVRILDRSLESDGLRIYLGSETGIEELDGLGFVAAPAPAGAVGIIGPVRMNYQMIIPIVDYAAGFIGRHAEEGL